MSQRTKEFPTKNSGDYNNQWNEITGQTDLNYYWTDDISIWHH
jgi:hypothetical protein